MGSFHTHLLRISVLQSDLKKLKINCHSCIFSFLGFTSRVSGGDRHSALAPLIHDLIMQMTSGVIEASVGGTDYVPQMGIDWPGFPVLVASNLASNPGDYAWGRGGLDTIITQLMNQLDGTGPPPLTKDQISQIPTSKITKEQCGKVLLCHCCA